MSRLRIAPIVEGHGEVAAVRGLLTRIWTELLGGEFLNVTRPIRQPRSRLMQREHLEKAVKLARLNLREAEPTGDPALVLILLDADEDAPCEKGPELLGWAKQCAGDIDSACVLAKVEYETWFVAAAESLQDHLLLPTEETIPEDPESARAGKGWIKRRFRGRRYSETLDQPKLTAAMDLAMCRKRSPSFAKLCEHLERRLRT